MDAVVIDVKGAYIAACYFGMLPFIVALVGLALRYFGIENKRIPKGKPLYALLTVGLAVYFGLIWMWLFHDQFYQIVPKENGEWQLVYQAPERMKIISPADIEKIQPGLGGKGTARVVINMQDGATYRSAQMARHRLKETIAVLNALR